MTFMPTVAEIRTAAGKFAAHRAWRRFRAGRLLWKFEREYVPPIPPDQLVKPEEIAEIRANLSRRFCSGGMSK